MTSDRDPLELELESLRPPELSADLRARIGKAISAERHVNRGPAPMRSSGRWPGRWSARWLIAGGLAAAACAVVSIALFNHSRRVTARTPEDLPRMVIVPANEIHRSPTLAEYTRAAAQSPEQFDSMMNADAAEMLGPGGLNEIRAFGRSIDDIKK